MIIHPDKALFAQANSLPAIPVCEHYAGSERLISKSFELQNEFGPIFDITCDLEDGAAAGDERRHATMVVDMLRSDANRFKQAGVRIHGPESGVWEAELDVVLTGVGDVVAYITIPKVRELGAFKKMLHAIREHPAVQRSGRTIPVHVLIETHEALRQVYEFASFPEVEVLDFGLLDFIAEHGGAIVASAMRSPGQFEHHLIVRAKTEIVAAALAHGAIPSHSITLDLKDGMQAYLDARRAHAEFGFLRMWSIHPTQIRPIVEAMTPTYEELQKMELILVDAAKRDWAPMSVDGELHDKASYRYFWDCLRRARLSGRPIGQVAQAAFFADEALG